MERPLLLGLLLALGALLVLQARALRREAALRRERRAGALDEAPLADAVRRLEPDGLARVAGAWRGARVDLRLVPDTLSIRKLPALWLMATLPEPQPLAATWHLMLRPRGAETFSAFADLPRALPLPSSLPADAGLRTDGGALPPGALAAMEEAVARLGEGRLKEVLLSPRGLRLTWLAEEAHRGRYLLFRDAEFAGRPPRGEIEALLDALLALRSALAAPERLIA